MGRCEYCGGNLRNREFKLTYDEVYCNSYCEYRDTVVVPRKQAFLKMLIDTHESKVDGVSDAQESKVEGVSDAHESKVEGVSDAHESKVEGVSDARSTS
jgi:hypothetical protein